MYSKNELNSMTKTNLQDLVDTLGLEVVGSGKQGQVIKADLVEAVIAIQTVAVEAPKESTETDEGPRILVDVKVPWVEVKEGGYRREFSSASNPHLVNQVELERLQRTKLFVRRN
jgi:hypothetical protein